jgi:hypothetical protein
MKEAMHAHGPFSGWKSRDSERDALLIELAEMLQPLVGFHVATPMASAQFKLLPQATREGLKNPQYCGFEACMRAVIATVKNPHMKVALLCDCSEQYSVECLRLYLRMRAHNQVFKDKCASLTFCEDEDFPPLQAADMLAYCIRSDYTRQITSPPKVVDDLLTIFRRDGSRDTAFVYELAKANLGSGILEGVDLKP